ncbi:tumor necrosis factor receptor superfamily member 10C [Biomphalaria pfeifferi]|uniref:Tumor necrosis factor receptor superfamily member 10C n=1 Tax=Biomphalaria pfeifferi TaxID=112525 RepID=A0AAD8C431_BIOPF|nr:tumor necrosis factor receptor superfamily member 10C [Biomphalaria pfeifferi]
MNTVVLVCIIALNSVLAFSGRVHCPLGQFQDVSGACVPCPNGSYLSVSANNESHCQPCTHEQPVHTVVKQLCNSTHDVSFKCEDGWFSTNNQPVICQVCTKCQDVGQYEAKACFHKHDAVCCPSKDMTLRALKGNQPCQTRSSNKGYCCILSKTPHQIISNRSLLLVILQPTSFENASPMCARNMYLNTHTNSCSACDPCSYVDLDIHTQQSCDLCSEGKNTSHLVYCPTRCRQSEGLTLALRFGLSFVILLAVPFVLVIAILALLNNCHPKPT